MKQEGGSQPGGKPPPSCCSPVSEWRDACVTFGKDLRCRAPSIQSRLREAGCVNVSKLDRRQPVRGGQRRARQQSKKTGAGGRVGPGNSTPFVLSRHAKPGEFAK